VVGTTSVLRAPTPATMGPSTTKRPQKSGEERGYCRRWVRDAGVEYRGVHNLRRSTVNVLAKADSTMEKITAVTGQTIEVARRCYLTIDAKSQRETMEKLSEIYGLANIPEPCKVVAEPELINTSCLITLTLEPPAARALTRLLQLPPPDSGTKSGTTGTLVPLKPIYIKDRRKLAERGGFEPPIELPLYTRSRRAP
jgi:hypothetical protein